jgi:hypothetical protein
MVVIYFPKTGQVHMGVGGYGEGGVDLFIMLLYSNRDIVMHFPRACVYDIIAILVNCQDVELL